MFHAGDGNLHPLICYDEQIPGQGELAEKVASEILMYCIEAGGSITGEHGVGADKSASCSERCFPKPTSRRCSCVRCAFDPAEHLQSRKGFSDAAPVRRSARALPPASSRTRRAGRKNVMSVVTLVDAAVAIVGADSARPGTSADAIDGVTPQVVVEPVDAEGVASIAALGLAGQALRAHERGRNEAGLGPTASLGSTCCSPLPGSMPSSHIGTAI